MNITDTEIATLLVTALAKNKTGTAVRWASPVGYGLMGAMKSDTGVNWIGPTEVGSYLNARAMTVISKLVDLGLVSRSEDRFALTDAGRAFLNLPA